MKSSTYSSAKSIVNCTARFAEVRAVPGGGKTHTLLRRGEHLLATGVPAEHILILSFSNASVDELRRRIAALPASARTVAGTHPGLSRVKIQTAHAFAFGLKKKKQRLLTDKELLALLGQAIKSVVDDCKNSKGPWSSTHISEAKRQLRVRQLEELALAPAQQKFVLRLLAVARASKQKLSALISTPQFDSLKPYVSVILAVRSRLALMKKIKGVIDYSDMLHRAAVAISNGTAESVPYTHILVDEYQDCSAAQTDILAKLALKSESDHPISIMVFSDPNQAIFGFGGAYYTPLSSALPEVAELRLARSWRLTARNAALASAVACHRSDRAIEANHEHGDGALPILVRDKSLTSQTAHIVEDIKQLLAGGTSPEQIVVLARTKALLAPVEQLLLANQVQTSRRGIRRHSKHVLRVLRLIRVVERCEQAATEALKSKRELGLQIATRMKKSLSRLTDVDDRSWKDASTALTKAFRVKSLEGRYRLCAKIYLRLLGGIRKDVELRADVNRWEASCRPHQSATAMLDSVLSFAYKGAAVTSTIHAAKGGEWDHVFIVGVTEGLLPLYLEMNDEHSLVEERNLLYVAITRARKTVQLYHAPTGHARSRKNFSDLSRFLDEPAVLRHVAQNQPVTC